MPATSFVHVDAASYPLCPDGPGRWSVAGTALDDWLVAHAAPPMSARLPVLAYGSNRCPSKITWLRATLGLGAEPVIVLRAVTSGVAAVWAAGLRARDGQRPAVLAAAPGVDEEHAVWLATPEQIAVLDVCEGRDVRFRLARLHTGTVRTDDGVLVEAPWCYLGHATARRPLLVDGEMVRCADVPQDVALHLDGVPAPGDGLDAEHVHGAPWPDEWPAALFVYGLLRPGQPSWERVAGHAAGPPRRASVAGAVMDTGRGYPAWLPDGPGSTPGWVVPLRDPTQLLDGLDEYEGPDYQRVRVVADGTVCWAYAWRSGPWPPSTPR